MGVPPTLKAFEELAATFQVGTNRTTADLTGHLPEQPDSERAALLEAGALDLMRRAGFESREGVEPIPSAPTEQSAIVKGAAGPISEALERNFVAIVTEWAEAAGHFGLVAPHSASLKLLELPAKSRRMIGPVLGERGRWMARLMEIDIEPARPDIDPAEHRKSLVAEWKDLDWKERAEGVRGLAVGLSLADEEFLAEALADKRKEVRETALDLLLILEHSQIGREIEVGAGGRLSLERKLLSKSLVVNPPSPEDLPKSLPKTTSRANFGPKALALFDLLRWTRPGIWEAQTGITPDQLIPMGEKTEYALALTAGWAEAALRFDDQTWIDALFQAANMTPQQGLFGDLLRRISDRLFESHIRNSGQSEGTLTAVLIRERALSPNLSRTVVDIARNSANWDHKPIAAQLDVTVLPFLEQSWEGPRDAVREHWRIYLDIKRRLNETLINR